MPEQQSDLEPIRKLAWRIADNPGPLIINGTVVNDPDTGQPLPDQRLRVDAIRLIMQVNRAIIRSLRKPLTLDDIRTALTEEEDADD